MTRRPRRSAPGQYVLEDAAQDRNAEPAGLRSGNAGVSAGAETQLVVSGNGCGHRDDAPRALYMMVASGGKPDSLCSLC